MERRNDWIQGEAFIIPAHGANNPDIYFWILFIYLKEGSPVAAGFSIDRRKWSDTKQIGILLDFGPVEVDIGKSFYFRGISKYFFADFDQRHLIADSIIISSFKKF